MAFKIKISVSDEVKNSIMADIKSQLSSTQTANLDFLGAAIPKLNTAMEITDNTLNQQAIDIERKFEAIRQILYNAS